MNHNLRIDTIKGILIISVIIAHTTSSFDVLKRVYQLIGILGVPCFFFISGYLNSLSSEKKIVKQLRYIIPWVILGGVTYLINSLAGSENSSVTIVDLLKYLVGYHSHLYYLSILLMFQVASGMFRNLKIWKFIESIALGFTIIFAVYYDITGVKDAIFYPYLNPLFWLGYWGLGRTFEKKWKDKLIKTNCIKPILLFWSAVIIEWVAGKSFITYFSLLSIVLNLATIYVSCYYICNNNLRSCEILARLGKSSLFIYLSHNVVIGLLNIIIKNNIVWDLAKPLLVVLMYVTFFSFINNYLWKYPRVQFICKKMGIKP